MLRFSRNISITLALAGSAAFSLTALAQDEAPPPLDPSTPWLEGWKGSIDLGLNGASGNTERFNFRAGLNAARDTTDYKTTFELTYNYGQDDGDESENRLYQLLRNDWKFDDSPWGFFAQESLEIDSFADWDQRLSLFAGPSYQFIKNEKTSVNLRAGLGLSKEFGGEDDDWTPEALLGADLEHKIDDRSKVTASVDLYPSLDDAGEMRAIAKAAYEYVLSEESNMIFKAGVEDRYDSSPGDGQNRNDFTYFATVGWTF
ncbi:MAG: DUF481 domain-containing protein [Phycisphaeraceae bacterium]|nr:DUF481 domain-containing protein [Phycisphaerales bacterium]MCB9861441.1 DUF481 domain-containing protein [Phycisphaeraceae bacterium]